jgi:hypothetical protein
MDEAIFDWFNLFQHHSIPPIFNVLTEGIFDSLTLVRVVISPGVYVVLGKGDPISSAELAWSAKFTLTQDIYSVRMAYYAKIRCLRESLRSTWQSLKATISAFDQPERIKRKDILAKFERKCDEDMASAETWLSAEINEDRVVDGLTFQTMDKQFSKLSAALTTELDQVKLVWINISKLEKTVNEKLRYPTMHLLEGSPDDKLRKFIELTDVEPSLFFWVNEVIKPFSRLYKVSVDWPVATQLVADTRPLLALGVKQSAATELKGILRATAEPRQFEVDLIKLDALRKNVNNEEARQPLDQLTKDISRESDLQKLVTLAIGQTLDKSGTPKQIMSGLMLGYNFIQGQNAAKLHSLLERLVAQLKARAAEQRALEPLAAERQIDQDVVVPLE